MLRTRTGGMGCRRLLVVLAMGVAAGCSGGNGSFGSAAAGAAGNAGSGNGGGTGGATSVGTSGSSGTASVDTDGGITSSGGVQGSPGGAAGHAGSGGTLPNAGAGGGSAGTSAGTGGANDAGAGGESSQTDAGTTLPCNNPTTYFLDHDGDGFGGDIAEDACETPEPVLPLVDDDLTTGLWVMTGGDCGDNSEYAYPGSPNSRGSSFSRLGWTVPSYDYDCDGLEEPTNDTEWVGAVQNCTRQSAFQCTGDGIVPTGDRSQSEPGANDLCGGVEQICTADGASSGPCAWKYNGTGAKNSCR